MIYKKILDMGHARFISEGILSVIFIEWMKLCYK